MDWQCGERQTIMTLSHEPKAGNIRQHYPVWLLQAVVAMLFSANAINIGADLGAMGDALTLLIGGPQLLYVIIFGLVCAVLQIFMKYTRYVSVLKWLTPALFAYFGTAMVVKIPWREVARGLILPTLSHDPKMFGRWSSQYSGRR
jgi:Mn2+/Fe2+ NRAMP family transporter